MLVLFAGWGAYFVWALIRFRAKRSPVANPAGARGRFAFGIEIGVAIAEVVLLTVFALPLWFARTGPPPQDARTIVLRVVAEQFNWNVLYPGVDGKFGETSVALMTPTNPLGLNRRSPNGRDDIVELNVLHLPVGHPVLIQLTSKDVIHSFGVPAMRVKQDAIPGLLSTVWFTPNLTGQFDIQCSQLCGLGHYRMRGVMIVESEDAFRKFLASEAASQGQ